MESSDRMGGAALIAAAAGTIIGMAHHPTPSANLHIGPLVHGLLIFFVGLSAFGFAAYCAARGPGRPAILGGAVSYGFALLGHTGAATINGFAVAALAARGEPIGRDTWLLAWEMNQALAQLGVVAAGIAILHWSADLLASRRKEARALGFLGLLAGGAPSMLLVAGAIDMDLTGASIAYAAHAVWGALLGLHLLRGKACHSG